MTTCYPLDLVIRKSVGDLFQEIFRGQVGVTPDCSWLEKINREKIEILRENKFLVEGEYERKGSS